MKRVLTLLITFAICLLFWLREVLLKHGWIDVQTPRDLYVHLHAAHARRADSKIQKIILKAHEAGQRLVAVSMDDEVVVDEFRNAGFTVVFQESGKYIITW